MWYLRRRLSGRGSPGKDLPLSAHPASASWEPRQPLESLKDVKRGQSYVNRSSEKILITILTASTRMLLARSAVIASEEDLLDLAPLSLGKTHGEHDLEGDLEVPVWAAV